jgi:hypothetical protein
MFAMYVLTTGATALKFPYSLAELRRDNPNTSFPNTFGKADFADWGVYPVQPQEPPAFDPATETLSQAEPILRNGTWLQSWSVKKATKQEVQQRCEDKELETRSERNAKLTASDWTQLLDAPVDAAAWAAYRQALRNVTAQTGFPWSVSWPMEPGA